MKKNTKPRIGPFFFDDDDGKRTKGYDLKVCTWNVRTINRVGAPARLVDVLVKARPDITVLQEMRWTERGKKPIRSCDVYYSGHVNKEEFSFGVGFVVGKRLRRQVLSFTPVDERLATIRIKARFFNISFICAHAPTEEKKDEVKDSFTTSTLRWARKELLLLLL